MTPSLSIPFGRREGLFRILAALVVFLFSAGSLQAQDDGVMTARAVVQRTPVFPGDQFGVAIVMDFKTGWHAWPNKPVAPEGMDDFDPTPTVIKLAKDAKLPTGWTIHLDAIQWPEAHKIKTAGVTGSPIEILSYSDRSVAFVPVSLAADAAVGDISLPFEIDYQACDEHVCQQPTTAAAPVMIKLAPMGSASKANDESMFAKFDGSVFAKLHGGAKPAPDAGAKAPEKTAAKPATSAPTAAPAAAPAVMPSLFGFQLPSPGSPIGVIVLFIISALGGFVLNLTPCVLPVIPIKVMTLSQHAGGSRSKAFKLGLWMALGVVAFWAAIGIPMAFFSSALDPSRIIFGTWWVTFLIGLIISAMGFGIMGLFMINLPQSVYMINPKADSAWGSFVFGIMTAVLGLPCFGFVAGGLLAGAATLPPFVIMIVFVGIGMGMAAPYLLLSANPQWISKLPRTGPASELIKQVMGLLLLAAAAYFVSAAIKALLGTKPYLKDSMPWWAVAFFVLLASVWLSLRIFQIGKKAWPKVVMPVMSILAALLTGSFANSIANTSRIDHERKQAVLAAAGGNGGNILVTGAWLDYTPARFEQAKKAGKIIVADFTADWCINCKVLKKSFLDRDPVRSRLTSDDVVMIEVDCTDSKAPGWEWLRSLGRTAVPTLAVFSPSLSEPIIMNAYTSDTVMDALTKAKPVATGPADKSLADADGWFAYTPAVLQQAKESGKVIVADFTADWDINCKVLRKTFLDKDPVRSRLMNDDIFKIDVDCTRSDAPGWEWLHSMKRISVPALAILSPSLADPIIMNAYTSEKVLEALAKAKPVAAGSEPTQRDATVLAEASGAR